MVAGDNGRTGLQLGTDMAMVMDTARAEVDNVTTQLHLVVVNTVKDRTLRPDNKNLTNQVSCNYVYETIKTMLLITCGIIQQLNKQFME